MVFFHPPLILHSGAQGDGHLSSKQREAGLRMVARMTGNNSFVCLGDSNSLLSTKLKRGSIGVASEETIGNDV